MGSTALDKNHQGSQSSLSNGDFKIQESSSTVTLVKNDHRNLKKIKFRGWKNALALSFGWLFLYTGYLPMSSIQSSLNGDNGLGTVSLSVQSAMEMIGNLFLSNLIINKIGCKWTVAIGSFLFSSFIAANFYPMWGTMVPTAALAGLGVSLTWIAHNTYMTKLSQYYAEHTGIDFNTINIRFFGTFYSIYYSSNVVGNVASSFLLGADFEPDNETFSYDPMALCGSDYCNEDLGTYFHPDEEHGDHPMNFTQANSQRPEMQEVYSLCGFCLGSTILATLLFILCVDSLPSLGLPENMDDSKSPFQIFVATFQHLNNPNQLLLLPLTFYNGLDNDFIYTEFTKAFVTCPLGMEYIGFVAACYGIFGPISSLVSGWLSTRRTRFVPFLVAGVAHISIGVAMLYWNPVPGTEVLVYVMASVWGIGSGVWCSQMNAFYGIIFQDNLEAAFSNFHLWNSVASTLLYGTSHKVCTISKVYVMITVVSVGLLGYLTVAIKHQLQTEKQNEDTTKPVTLKCVVKFDLE